MFRFAFRNLANRPIRSLLALLGLTVAIMGMVGLFSVAEGIDFMVADTFGRIPGVVVIQTGAPIPLFSRIPADWGDEIAETEGVAVVTPEVWARVNVIENERIISPPRFLFGADIESRLQLKEAVYRDSIVAGRFLDLSDRGTLHAVISQPIAERRQVGVGDLLAVNGYELEIVGIYHCGSILLDVAIILDIDQVRMMSRLSPDSVNNFYVETDGSTDDELVVESIRRRFHGRQIETDGFESLLGLGGISADSLVGGFWETITKWLYQPSGGQPQGEVPPSSANADATEQKHEMESSQTTSSDVEDLEDSPVEVRSGSEWGERVDELSADLDIILGILTGIGVTIAVLSIVNTMLMSVSERIIEFGILKANGWTKLDVMKLITYESAVLGIAGGIAGSSLGWIATQIINWKWPDQVHLYASPGLLLFSLFFSTIVGMIGGLYPAYWATRMAPMDAIRRG